MEISRCAPRASCSCNLKQAWCILYTVLGCFASLLVARDLLLITFFLGEDATAVFLHIQAELASLILTLAETFPEVTINKFDTGKLCEIFANCFELVMLLIGRNEQGCSESVIAMLRGEADGFGEAFFVTIIDTAVFDVGNHIFAKFVEAVLFVND